MMINAKKYAPKAYEVKSIEESQGQKLTSVALLYITFGHPLTAYNAWGGDRINNPNNPPQKYHPKQGTKNYICKCVSNFTNTEEKYGTQQEGT